MDKNIANQKQLEKMLQENQELQTALDSVPAFVFYKDKENRIIRANKTLAAALGKSVQDIINRSCSELFPDDADRYASDDQDVIKSGAPKYNIIETLQTPTGKRWLQTNKLPYKDSSGNIIGIIGFSIDITDSILAEKSLRESEQKYLSLVTNIPDVTWTCNSKGNLTFVSPNLQKLCGYKPEEICQKGTVWFELTHPADLEKVKQALNKLFEKNTSLDVEHRIKTKDGKWVWVHNRSVTTYQKYGIQYADGVLSDITERKQTQQTLKDSEEKLRTIFEHGMDGILLADTETKKFSVANKCICQMLGYTQDELYNLGVNHIHPKENLPYAIEQFKKLHTKEITIARDIPVKRKDGTIFYADISGAPVQLGGKTYIVGIFRDITQHKTAEEELKKHRDHLEELVKKRTAELTEVNKQLQHEIQDRNQTAKTLQMSEELLSNIFESISDGILVLDRNFCYTHWNKAMEKISRTPREQVINNKPAWELFPKQVERGVHEMMQKAMQGQTTRQDNIPYRLEDGQSGFTSETFIPLRAATGEICGVVGIIRDITERKRAQEELGAIRDTLQHLLTCSPVVIYTCEPHANYVATYITENVLEQFGYTQDEFLSDPDFWVNHIHPEDRKRIIADLSNILQKSSYTHEYRFQYKDGSYHWVFDELKVIHDANGSPSEIVGSILDITVRKKAEEIMESLNKDLKTMIQKLNQSNSELQDFIHIVAHDLKSPLRAIGILATWLSTDYAEKFDEKGRERVNLLLGRTERMNNLIEGILQYAGLKRLAQKDEKVDLNTLASEVITKIQPPENIKITFENKLPSLICEKSHMTQVFQNLIDNAVKYMDKPKGQIKIGCAEQEGFWKFGITDNGPGIEEKHCEKIFKPLQTLSARDEYESTGIGLTVVKKIVELYNGKVWVESKLGKGSTFFFTLPKQEIESVSTSKNVQTNKETKLCD